MDVPPYEALAPFYDEVMHHVDYKEWMEYIDSIFNRYRPRTTTVLDAGCGTGKGLRLLRGMGYRGFGCDRSLAMSKSAARRCRQAVCRADITAMPFANGFDAVVCLFDTVHYLQPDQMNRFFAEVHRVLSPRGLFVFDVVTERHVLDYWADCTDLIRRKRWEAVRWSWFDRRRSIQHTEFDIFLTGRKTIWRESHRQRIYPLETVRQAAEKAGFFTRGCFEDMTFRTGGERSDRVHFVMRRGLV